MPRIVTISGTSRPDNYTARALAVVNARLRTLGLDPQVFDARELDLAFPGSPPTADAVRLREAVTAAAAVVLASPEYHGSFCAMTKLIIENLGFPSALAGKPVAMVGVAAGRIGAIKTLEQLRGVCSHVGAIVIPGAVSIAGVQQAFAADGRCTDAAVGEALEGLASGLTGFVQRYTLGAAALEESVREGEGPLWAGRV